MDQDSTCLQRFLATRDEQAFAELVRRHVDMVYSAARRQVRDDAAAQDVTQQVFVLLAAKARSIRSGEAAAGWLLATTRYVALNSFRTEQRRRRYEREAAVMHEQQQQRHGDAPQWSVVAPLLDEVVAKLKREDRDALALRYFQGRSVADVAAAVAGVLLAGVTGTIAYQQIRTPGGRSRQVKVDPAATMAAPAPSLTSHSFMSFDITAATNPAWRTAFDQIYMLAPGETMKRVPPPFVPERLTYYHVTAGTAQVQAIPDGPDIFLLSQGPQGLT